MPIPALLIVDMFSRFAFPDGERLAPRAVEAAHALHPIREAFDERDWPVIYANDNFGNWKCGSASWPACVLATAVEANSREYECLVVDQAVACLPERRGPSMDVLRQSGAARVVSATSLLPGLGFT